MPPIIGGPSGSKELPGSLSFWEQDGKNMIIAWGADNQAGAELAKHNGETARQAGIDYLAGSDTGTVDATKDKRYELIQDGVLDVEIRKK